MNNKVDLTGIKYERFLVVSKEKRLTISGVSRLYWKCLCDCGNEFFARNDHIVGLKIKSCGCLRSGFKNRVAFNAKPFGMAAANLVYRGYISRSKNRKWTSDLSFEDFLIISQQNCFYCGVEPMQEYKGNYIRGVRAGKRKVNGGFIYNGIDRIDSKIGYVKGNMRTCCKTCNYAKSNSSEEEFNVWANNFINHYKDKL